MCSLKISLTPSFRKREGTVDAFVMLNSWRMNEVQNKRDFVPALNIRGGVLKRTVTLNKAKHLNAIRYSPPLWFDPDMSGLTTNGFIGTSRKDSTPLTFVRNPFTIAS